MVLYDISFRNVNEDDGSDGGSSTGRSTHRVLQLGLGVGTAVTFLRQHGVPVDVVELNPEVVAVASSDFQYNSAGGVLGYNPSSSCSTATSHQ